MRFFTLGVFFWGVAMLLCGCSPETPAKFKDLLVCGIRPVGAIARAMLPEDKQGNVAVLLPENANAHQFDLSFKQLKMVQACVVYFGCGLPFEHKIADVCQRRYFEAFVNKDDEHADLGQCDPHVWMSFQNTMKIGENIAVKLQKIYPHRAPEIKQNYVLWANDLAKQREKCAQVLSPYRGRKFYVYHPAFGGLAEEFGLVQRAVERDGKEPSAQYLAAVAKEMKENNAKVIYVQPGFNSRMAGILADATGAKIREINPMGDFDQLEVISMVLWEGFQ